MSDKPDHVMLIQCQTQFEAMLVVSILAANGIPAHADGLELQDEWAASQKMLGNIGQEVRVPASSLAEAQRILEEAHEAGRRSLEDPGKAENQE